MQFYRFSIIPHDSYLHPHSKTFIEACKFNEYAIVEELIDLFPQLVFEYDHIGMTGLHWACKNNNERIAHLLISKRAWVNATDQLSRKPIYFAVKAKNSRLVRELLLKMADPWTPPGCASFTTLSENDSHIGTYLKMFRIVSLCN